MTFFVATIQLTQKQWELVFMLVKGCQYSVEQTDLELLQETVIIEIKISRTRDFPRHYLS